MSCFFKAMTHTPTRPSSWDQSVCVAYLKTGWSGLTPDGSIGFGDHEMLKINNWIVAT